LEVVVTWKELTTSGADISIQIEKNASAVIAYQLEFDSNSSAASLFFNIETHDPSAECIYKLLEAEIVFVGYVVYWENATYREFPHNQSNWIGRSYQYEVGSTWAIAYENQYSTRYRFNIGGLVAEMQAIYSENQSIPVNRDSLPVDGFAMVTIRTSCAVRNVGDSYFVDVQALSSPGSSEIVLSLPNASAVSSFSSNAVRLRPNAFWVRVRADEYERFYIQYDLPSPELWYLMFPYRDLGVGLFLIGVGALLSKAWSWVLSYRKRSRQKSRITT
jgi:hypothetical protein